MTTLRDFLEDLTARDVKLWVEGENLRCSAPEGSLTPDLVRELQSYKTDILATLRAAQGDAGGTSIPQVARTGPLQLSYAQQRLWFLDRLGSGSAYNMAGALKLDGPLDHSALNRSLAEIVHRHEILRTTFPAVDNEPRQVIAPISQLNPDFVDLRQFPEQGRADEVHRLIKVEALRTFDLTRDPMLRVTLLRLAEQDHILLLTMHHIAGDGWSVGIFIEELVELYGAFARGLPTPLPPLPIQYADFACAQRQWLQGERLSRQLEFWRTRLSDAPRILSLPADRPRPAVQTFHGGSVSFTLGADLTGQLKAVGREAGATLFMTLLAAFQVLLCRYTGETDIVVGSPIANRNRREIEPLIGFFVNTLALRTELGGNPTFDAVLEQVRRNTQDAYDHQDLPFEKLVDELNPERNLAYSPIVQVIFALQQPPTPRVSAAQLQFSVFDFGDRVARFDLEAHVWEADDRIDGSLVYNTSLFDEDTIRRMAGHFQTLLSALARNPRQHIANLPLMTDDERRLLLVEWNKTAADFPADKCVHELIEERAHLTPEAIAVVSGTEAGAIRSLTYGELNTRANQLAHYLISRGAGAGTPVVICTERSPETIVGLLGILKAGAYYVPLLPSDPQERRAFFLEDAQARIVLTQERLAAGMPAQNTQIVCLDKDWDAIAAFDKSNPVRKPASTDFAYLIYTSGSTGKPKGVTVPHRGLMNLVCWHRRAFLVSAQDHATQLASLAFDAAGWEIWPYLTAGSILHLVPSEIAGDPERLKDWLIARAITIAFVPTPLAEQMLALDWPREVPLRIMLTGGDKLHTAGSSPRPFQLVNNYGPTENTVVATSCAVPPNGNSAPPIGRPIANVRVYILDSHLQPVPVGVPGELCIAGDSVAAGYHNRPELTAEKFIPNPYGPGALYRTGDLTRYLPGGDIEFLGRIDAQLKIRGFRLEPGEIEAVLTEHPGVREAVVVAHGDNGLAAGGDKRLTGYLVPAIHTAAATEHVTQWQALYEETYGKTPKQQDATFNLTGWQSSYTGEPIPEAEMAEWVEHTVAEIRALGAKRILEIGCGSGLLLSRLAPDAPEYWGTDYSREALQHVERIKAAAPGLAHVKLSQRMADDFTGIEPGAFDLVILNSVIQYFPGIDYLMQVLEGAVRSVRAGGSIYVGDIRNFDLLEAYHASVQLYQAPDDLTRSHLAQRVLQRVRDEEELLVSPAFFAALQQRLPQIDRAQIRLKRGHHHNELTRFRYQVVLSKALPQQSEASAPGASDRLIGWQDWRQTTLTLDTLREKLSNERPAVLGLRSVPNARLQSAAHTLAWLKDAHHQTVSQLRQARPDPDRAVDPEALWALSDALPYQVQVLWSDAGAQQGAMDVLFTRNTEGSTLQALDFRELPRRAWREYGNNPLLGKLSRTLIPAVRQFLQQKLPDYMAPSAYVLLDALPLTPNGKVDRRKLPAPVLLPGTLATAFTPPGNATQATVAQIWSEVLGIERLGIHDNFFEAGGHSLLATQVISRINQSFSLNLPLRTLFEEATVAHLSEAIENARWAAQPAEEQSGEFEEVEL